MQYGILMTHKVFKWKVKYKIGDGNGRYYLYPSEENFSLVMDRVCEDHAPVIITRQNNTLVVMISLEDFNTIEETLYLMRIPKNYARLLKSIKNVEKSRVKQNLLIENQSNAAI